MSTLAISLGSLACILALIALRVPPGLAMGGVAIFGFAYLRNWTVAFSVLGDAPFVFAAHWELSAIPTFLLMGAVASNSGIGTALFRAARVWFGRMPGGLAVARPLSYLLRSISGIASRAMTAAARSMRSSRRALPSSSTESLLRSRSPSFSLPADSPGC